MDRREEARHAAEACIKHLTERFPVKSVSLCGSLAGESPWHARSDIDLVVEGLAPEDYIAALTELWELVPPGLELDLIRLEEAPPGLARRMRGDEKMPEDPKQALEVEIREQLESLEQVVQRIRDYLPRAPSEPPEPDIAWVGKLVHDFYNGVERIFERIAVRMDEDVPPGPRWHTDLLRRMEGTWTGKRPSVIDHALALRLLEYLRFRHLFRYTYGYELLWRNLQPLAVAIPEVFGELRQQLQTFLSLL
jgi:predicted nucleotidyltransferase